MWQQRAWHLNEELSEILRSVQSDQGERLSSSPLASDHNENVFESIEHVVDSFPFSVFSARGLGYPNSENHSRKPSAKFRPGSEPLKSALLLDELEHEITMQLSGLDNEQTPTFPSQEPQPGVEKLLDQARSVQKDVKGLRKEDVMLQLREAPLEFLPEVVEDILQQGNQAWLQAEACHDIIAQHRATESDLYEQVMERRSFFSSEEQELRTHLRDAYLRCKHPKGKPWRPGSACDPSADAIVQHIQALEQTVDNETSAMKAAEANLAQRLFLEEHHVRDMLSEEKATAAEYEARQEVLNAEESEVVAWTKNNERSDKEIRTQKQKIQAFQKLEHHVILCQREVLDAQSELEAYQNGSVSKSKLKAWERGRRKHLEHDKDGSQILKLLDPVPTVEAPKSADNVNSRSNLFNHHKSRTLRMPASQIPTRSASKDSSCSTLSAARNARGSKAKPVPQKVSVTIPNTEEMDKQPKAQLDPQSQAETTRQRMKRKGSTFKTKAPQSSVEGPPKQVETPQDAGKDDAEASTGKSYDDMLSPSRKSLAASQEDPNPKTTDQEPTAEVKPAPSLRSKLKAERDKPGARSSSRSKSPVPRSGDKASAAVRTPSTHKRAPTKRDESPDKK